MHNSYIYICHLIVISTLQQCPRSGAGAGGGGGNGVLRAAPLLVTMHTVLADRRTGGVHPSSEPGL